MFKKIAKRLDIQSGRGNMKNRLQSDDHHQSQISVVDPTTWSSDVTTSSYGEER